MFYVLCSLFYDVVSSNCLFLKGVIELEMAVGVVEESLRCSGGGDYLFSYSSCPGTKLKCLLCGGGTVAHGTQCVLRIVVCREREKLGAARAGTWHMHVMQPHGVRSHSIMHQRAIAVVVSTHRHSSLAQRVAVCDG